MTTGLQTGPSGSAETQRCKDALNAAFLTAIERGLRKKADELKGRVDWRAFDALSSPVGKVLANDRWNKSFSMLLEYARRRVAEKAMAGYDFEDRVVQATGFWNNAAQQIHRQLRVRDGATTFPARMEIHFRPGCAIPVKVSAHRIKRPPVATLGAGDDSKIGAYNHDMDSLLPYAAIGCTTEEMPFFALDVMRWCVEYGRHDLVSQPFVVKSSMGTPVARQPLYECVTQRFPEGVLLCLENGADPQAPLKASHGSALGAADMLNYDNITLLIKSFQSRTSALDAVREIASLMVDSPGKARPV